MFIVEGDFIKKQLYRTKYNKMLFGVCNGLAEYFNIDVSIIRILFVIATLFFGGSIIVYIALAIILPVKY